MSEALCGASLFRLFVKVFSLELPSDCVLEENDSVAIEIHLDGTCVERTSDHKPKASPLWDDRSFMIPAVLMANPKGGFLPRTIELRLVRRPRQAENGAPPPPPSASSATDDSKLTLARYTLDAATFAATTSTSKPKAPAAKPVTVRLTPTTRVRETRKHNDSATTSSSALLPAANASSHAHSSGTDGELLVTVGCTYARPANTSEALAAAQSALATAEAATVAVVGDSAAAAPGASTPGVDPAAAAASRPKVAGAAAHAPPLPPFQNQARASVAVPPVFDLPSTAASPHAVDQDTAPVGSEIERNSSTKKDKEPSSPPRDAAASAVTPMAEAPSSPDHHAMKDSVSSRQDPPLSPEEAPSSPSNGSSNNVTPGRRFPAPSYADLSQVEQYRALTLLYNEANKAMSGRTETWSSPRVGPAAVVEPTTASSSSTRNSHVNSPPGLIRRSGTAGKADDNSDDSDDNDDYSASFRERAANNSYDSGLAALLVEVDSLVRSPDRHSRASLNSSRNSQLSTKHRRGDGTRGGAGSCSSSEEAPDGVEAIMAEEARILEALSVDLEGMVVAARHGRHPNGSWSGGKSELGTPPPLHGLGGADGGNRGHLDFDDTFDSELSPLFWGAQWVEGAGDAKKLRSWLVRDVLPAHPTAARAFAAAAASTGGAVGALGSSFPESAPAENRDAGSSLFEATVDAIPSDNGGDVGIESNGNFILDAGGSIVEALEPLGEAAEPLGLDGVSTNALGRALGVTFELARRGDQVKTLALSQAAWDQSDNEEDYEEEEEYEESEDDTDSEENEGGDEEEGGGDNESGGVGDKEEEVASSGGRTDTGSPRSPERFPHAPDVDPAVPSNVDAGRCGAALSNLEALVELSFTDAPSLEGALSELLAPLCRRHRRMPRHQFTLDDVSNADRAVEHSFDYEEGSDAYEGLRALLLERCSALTGPLTAAALVGKQDDEDDDEANFEDDEDVGVQQEEQEWKETVQECTESMNDCLVRGEDSDEKVALEGSTNVPVDGNGADSIPQSPVKAPEQIDAGRKEKVVVANSRLTKAEAVAAAATASSSRAMFQDLQEKNAKSKKNGTKTAKSPGRHQAVHSDGGTTTNTSRDNFSISRSSAFKEYSRSPPSKSSSSNMKATSPWKPLLSRQALAQAEKSALTRGHRTAARLLAALPRPSPSPSPASLLLSNLPQASARRRNWSLLELRLRHCDSLSGGLEALAALPALRVLDLRHTPLGSGHAPGVSGHSRWSSGRDNRNSSDNRDNSSSSSSGDHLRECESNKNGSVKDNNEGKSFCVAEVLGHSCPMLQELWLDNTLVDGPINALSNCTKLRILSAPHTNFFVANENSMVDVEGVEKPQLNAGETHEGATNSLATAAETSNEPLSSEESEEVGCTLEVVDLGSTQVSGSLANLLCALGGGRRMCALKHLDLTHQESLGGSLAVFQSALSRRPSIISAHSSSTIDLPQSALQCLGLRGTAVEGDLSDLFPNLNSSNGSREYDAPISGSDDNNSLFLDSSRDPPRNPPCIHMLETIDVRGTAVTDAWGLAARLEDLAGCAVRMDHARTALTTPRKAGRPAPRVLTLEEESTGSGASLPSR